MVEPKSIEHLKQLLNNYSQDEFGHDVDFDNPKSIGIAYTTTEDGEHEIQVYADIINFGIDYMVDNEFVAGEQFSGIGEMCDFVYEMTFDELVAEAEDRYNLAITEGESK